MALSSQPAACDEQRHQPKDDLAEVRNALRGLQFGSVQIIVQDGVIVQVERTEKRRLRRKGEGTSTT
jgi:hypothetical protein